MSVKPPVMYSEEDVRNAINFLDYCIIEGEYLPGVKNGHFDLESISNGLNDIKNILEKLDNNE